MATPTRFESIINPEFSARTVHIQNGCINGSIDFMNALDSFRQLREEADSDDNLLHRGWVEKAQGMIYMHRANYGAALRHFERAKDFFIRSDGTTYLAGCEINIGEVYRLKGNYKRARAYFTRAYEMALVLRLPKDKAVALLYEGQAWLSMKRLHKAEETLQQALEMLSQPLTETESSDDTQERLDMLCDTHHALVVLSLQRKRLDEAWQHAEKTLYYAQEIRSQLRLGYANRALGDVITALKEPPDRTFRNDPDYYYRLALKAFDKCQTQSEIGKTLYAQGVSMGKRGKRRSAARIFQQAMIIFSELGMTDNTARAAEAQLDML